MHTLHKILVYIPNVECFDGITDLKKKIRNHAVNTTECYNDSAFDWRETDTAGRWSDTFPDNVLFANKNLDTITNLLKQEIKEQEVEKECLIKDIAKEWEEDFATFIDKLQESEALGWAIKRLCFLCGNGGDYYGAFYDTNNWSSFLSEETIAEIEKNPDDWALCLFDCHI